MENLWNMTSSCSTAITLAHGHKLVMWHDLFGSFLTLSNVFPKLFFFLVKKAQRDLTLGLSFALIHCVALANLVFLSLSFLMKQE